MVIKNFLGGCIMTSAKYTVDGGVGKVLEVYEDHIALVAQKTARALLTGNIMGGTKEFYYSDMTSVQFKPSNMLINGYIQIEYPGSQSGVHAFGDNFTSENSFVFMKAKVSNEKMQEIVNYIKGRIRDAKNVKTGATIISENSPADEILKYKSLLESGIISQDEFEAKKKELLGL